MPKFKLTEIDNTGSIQLNPITNVVYIPGKANAKMDKPELCSSVNDLTTLASTKGLVDDLSYKLAKRCLQLGMQVLYQGFLASSSSITWKKGEYSAPIVEDSETGTKTISIMNRVFTYDDTHNKLSIEIEISSETYSFEFAITSGACEISTSNVVGGTGSSGHTDYVDSIFPGIPNDGEANDQYQTILFDYVNNQVAYNWFGIPGGAIQMTSTDWEALNDKALYDIRFLTTGGYPTAIDASMITCAEKRGDCIALVDHTQGVKDVQTIRSYLQPFNSSKAAAFTPWFTSNVEEFGRELIPPSFGYLFAYARSIQNNPDWYAVAGTFRGSIPELKEVQKDYSTAEVEMLQGRAPTKEVELDGEGDNTGIAINPIAYIRGFGYLIWGNRTLVINEGYTKATSFLNVRNLCSDIVKTCYAAAKRYTFEQNSNTLWLNFKHQIQPLLDRMVSGNGIASYTFEQLPTSAKARLKARITITPIEGVEDFELELYLEDSLEVIE